MISAIEVIWLIIAGMAGGFMAGLLGIGGGPVYVIIFSEYLRSSFGNMEDVWVKLTIANSVFATFFATISGSVKQLQVRNFFPRTIALIAIPSVISSLITIYLILGTTKYTSDIYSLLFIFIILPLIVLTLTGKGDKEGPAEGKIVKTRPAHLIGLGIISGIITSLSGLGGGFIIIPVLTGIFRFPIKKAISISLGTIAFVAFCFSIFNLFVEINTGGMALPYSQGLISFFLTVPVIIGVIICAPIGVYVSKKLPSSVLKIIFTLFLTGIIVKMLYNVFG